MMELDGSEAISTLVVGGVSVEMWRGGVEMPPVVTSDSFESSVEVGNELRISIGKQFFFRPHRRR